MLMCFDGQYRKAVRTVAVMNALDNRYATLKQLRESTWTAVSTFFRATYEPTAVSYATCT
jgi:hypothetical protein